MRLMLAVGASLVALVTAAAQSRPSAPAYRAETELVRITATVANTNGDPVMNLREDEFTVVDNGQRQEIALFSQDAMTPVSVLVLLDISGSMQINFPAISDGLQRFLLEIRPEDEVALMTFADRVELAVPFGSEQEGLLGVVQSLTSGGSTALYDGIVQGLDLLKQARHEKRVMFLLTDGNDTKGRVDGVDAAGAFARSDALVYGIGLGHGSPGSFLSLFDRGRMRVMRSFARASGGRAELVPNPDGLGRSLVSDMFAAYGRELHQQYTIGYYPSRAGRSPKHEVRVTVNRPGMVVRARSVYRTR